MQFVKPSNWLFRSPHLGPLTVTNMSYLHPSQKGTSQVGSINHTNTYHVGVLAGNWMEERNSFGPQPKRDFKFTAKSETHEKYPPRTVHEYAGAKPPQCAQPEAPRALIFGEETGPNATGNLQTIHELSYQNIPQGGKALRTHEIFAATGNSPRRTHTVDKRRENGTLRGKDMEAIREMVAEELSATQGSNGGSAASPSLAQPHLGVLSSTKSRQQFLTTKNVTTDATGEYMQTHPEVFVKSKCSSRGEVIKTLRSPMMKTGFRKD